MKRAHRRAHGWMAMLLATLVLVILLGAAMTRQDRSAAPPPERLEAPR